MGDEEKTRSGRKQATPQEGETAPGAQAGETVVGGQACETPQTTTGQQPVVCLPSRPPPSPEAEQAREEYAQISRELDVVSPSVEVPQELREPCGAVNEPPLTWCLPDLNCSARSAAVQAAFNNNRPCLDVSA